MTAICMLEDNPDLDAKSSWWTGQIREGRRSPTCAPTSGCRSTTCCTSR
ncbi:MAG: hypothetical protein MZV64_72795 [Ignavibacteriales bacterium]|nr:hypothetical protein [Ignavibacteriales bacterium]